MKSIFIRIDAMNARARPQVFLPPPAVAVAFDHMYFPAALL
jgi:hypothetical protein